MKNETMSLAALAALALAPTGYAQQVGNNQQITQESAIGHGAPIQIGPATEMPGCAIERSVNGLIGDALKDAEAMLMERFRQKTLADLAEDFHLAVLAKKARRDTG